ncbi:MAG: hypothetical protein VKK04_24340 [Synechococcales bacterium]|nr:hypothetical protein [Synechococcales bacterium]
MIGDRAHAQFEASIPGNYSPTDFSITGFAEGFFKPLHEAPVNYRDRVVEVSLQAGGEFTSWWRSLS